MQDLRQHYEHRDRPEAIHALIDAIQQASTMIEANPDAGLPTPRPYSQLASKGRAWVKAGRYWIGYRTTRPPVIVAVFYDAADIPGRL